MKIIQNNYTLTGHERYICEDCNSVFEFEDTDIHFSDFKGEEYVTCPCCGHVCFLGLLGRKEELSFPNDFYQFSVREGAVQIENEEITDKIKECIEWLKENPQEPFKYIGTGDTFLCVFNHEDEYYIMVAKNYFDAYIDK
jgi:DNA-directed RNA polymerase subunit RPC12/RpoP